MFFDVQDKGEKVIKRVADEIEIRASKKIKGFLHMSIVDDGNPVKLHNEPLIKKMS